MLCYQLLLICKEFQFILSHRDLKTADAEMLYLENARRIPLYGVELHDALVSGLRIIFVELI